MKGVKHFQVVLVFLLFLSLSLVERGTLFAAKDGSFASPSAQADADARSLPAVTPKGKVKIQQDYGKLPLYFIENRGQLDEQIKFYEQGPGHAIYFTPKGLVFLFHNNKDPEAAQHYSRKAREHIKADSKGTGKPLDRADQYGRAAGIDFLDQERSTRSELLTPEVSSIRLTPLGMNANVEIIAGDPQEGKVNYFVGNDAIGWRTNIPTYGSVTYREAYPGIDLKFYGNNRQLEYDIIAKPGADVSQVKFQYSGMDSITIDDTADLSIQLKTGGKLIQRKPLVYQMIDGKRVKREGAFRLEHDISSTRGAEPNQQIQNESLAIVHLKFDSPQHVVSFQIASYDERYPLVIDPVLVYSSCLAPMWAGGIALDNSGNAYLAGFIVSADFPVANPLYGYTEGFDAFVVKIDASGSALVYATYLGGTSHDLAESIAVDGSGNAYLTGEMQSSDFPTLNAAFSCVVGNQPYNAFVTKLNSTGTALVYSTCLGGSNYDVGSDITVDITGNACLTGETRSNDFQTVNALFSSLHGYSDAFVTKLNSSGNCVYSTYLGGGYYDVGLGIATDNSGNAYVTGYTGSNDFPTTENALYPELTDRSADAFITKINSSGTALVFSSYLGGSGSDIGYDIAVDSSENVYITGETLSIDFPTKNEIYTYAGDYDTFVTKLDITGRSLVFSTYLSGSGRDMGYGIAVDNSQNVYITGIAGSEDFPKENNLFEYVGGLDGESPWDAFVTKLNKSGTGLVYSTCIGGNAEDVGKGIAVDNQGNAYVTGTSNYAEIGQDFPLLNPLFPDLTYGGFVAKIYDDFGACIDVDADGYYGVEDCGTSLDCHDNDSTIHPDASEICDDFKDNDCNGKIDCVDPSCSTNNKCLSKLASGALDRDGIDDLIKRTSLSEIYISKDHVTWSQVPGKLACVTACDLDGDGLSDIAGVTSDTRIRYAFAFDDFSNWHEMEVGRLSQLACGDLNGDGRGDLVGVNSSDLIFYTLDLTNWYWVPGYLSQVASGDFNGDGHDDIVGVHSSGLIFYTLDLWNWHWIPGYLSQVASGDFNGDGHDDIVGVHSSGLIFYTPDLWNWQWVWGMLNEIVVGDFNNDGKDDLAGINFNYSEAIWYTTNLYSWSMQPPLACHDADGDGVPGDCDTGRDCDNNDSTIYPGATENCNDKKDNDCDGKVDCADPNCNGGPACTSCLDLDGDGYYAGDSCARDEAIDCNDNDPLVYPTALEMCEDGKVQDCNRGNLDPLCYERK